MNFNITIFKKLFKYIGKLILLFLGLLLLYLISAFVLSRITIQKEKDLNQEISIYILTNGVHTDLVLPVKSSQIDWSKKIKFENTILNDSTAQYVSLGWGDRGFYLETPEWADLKFSVALNAATGLGKTAIHATFYSKLMKSKTCKRIQISKNQYARLIKYIDASFQKDHLGNFIPIKTNANYSKTDAFYEAVGSYSLFHTCNTWANNGLKSCGQTSCFWTPFDTGIFLKYE